MAGAARHRPGGPRRQPRRRRIAEVRPPLTVTRPRRTTTWSLTAGRRQGRQQARRQGRHALGSGRRVGGLDPAGLGRPAAVVATAARRDRRACAPSCGRKGIDRVVLCGMGGSSLAPEVISRTYDVPLDDPRLDQPERGRAGRCRGDLSRTVVVVSSKSGGTLETDSQRRAFVAAFEAAGIDAGVTDGRRHRPRLRPGEAGASSRATARSSSPTRTSAAATAR